MKKHILFLFVLIVLLSSCSAQQNGLPRTKDTEPTVKDTNDVGVNVEFVNNNSYSDIGITNPMNNVIKEYFVRYFSAFGDFTDILFDDIYYFDTEYERGIINTMVAYQNKIRRDMSFDLGYDYATVGVTYRSITETEKGYDVYLVQNDAVNYNFASDITSYTSDVEHHFILKEISGEYYIVEHSEISGVYELITEKYDSYLRDNNLTLSVLTPSQITKTLDDLKDMLVNNVTTDLEGYLQQRADFNDDPTKFTSSVTAQNPYNAEEALKYSYEWVSKTDHKRNPAFTAYDEYGGNCNNFTSQCLLAGGIPMDLQGKQWKWYGEDINNGGGMTGRSSSWAACEYFYEYCRDNAGYGLVCDISENLYSGRPGDIVQYISDGISVHSVIITKVIYDEKGNVVDYLVNSNTTDKIDSPMSLYGYTNFRLIKILGYNG
ncbi:MAG: amidase domain-containing protein [Clostridia bacterium]|nr:amidase domain-containing protein [Clostridia bacterium]